MKVSIVDACFPLDRQSMGMSALMLRWQCETHGIEVVEPGAATVLMLTCVDPRNWDQAARLKKRYPGKVLIAGGAGALSPYSIGLHADAVCVGDSTAVIERLAQNDIDGAFCLPEMWINGETRDVIYRAGFPWDCPPIQCEDGAYRVWCGRGCKNRCAFCQTGWAMRYQENPKPHDLLRTIRQLKTRNLRVAYLSNDPNQHSFSDKLPVIEHGSYSVAYMRQSGLPSARQVRIGVEGVSERLRIAVFKPISHDDLLRCTVWLNQSGKSVRWFLIAGLPSETDADWDELRCILAEWKKLCAKGVLALSFTAWQPEPATPMGICPVDDSYWDRWCRFREWFFSGAGWSNRVKLMAPACPRTRMASAVARMGLTETELRSGGVAGPNDRVAYPHKAQRDVIRRRMTTIA